MARSTMISNSRDLVRGYKMTIEGLDGKFNPILELCEYHLFRAFCAIGMPIDQVIKPCARHGLNNESIQIRGRTVWSVL